MLALNITDIKDFMNKLLIGETFDGFSFIEGSITTFNTFRIDGLLQQDFFDTDAREALSENAQDYSLWRDLKSYCFAVIRGKRTPLSFKLVFRLPVKTAAGLLQKSCGDFPAETISGLYLNLQYKNKTLLCTTGISFRTFVPDKRPEQLWDSSVRDFLHRHSIAFTEM